MRGRPGVKRRYGRVLFLLARAGSWWFVAPDNGLLSWVFDRHKPSEIYRVLSSPDASHTFHGRDVIAPVAARLKQGEPASTLGEHVESYVNIPFPIVLKNGAMWQGEILAVDDFGNLITNVRSKEILPYAKASKLWIEFEESSSTIRGLSPSYGSVEVGKLCAVEGSDGFIEIAANSSRRCRHHRLGRGRSHHVSFPHVKKTGLFIFLLPLFLAAPFLNRAYFVDDHYFVQIATWLKDHPWLPYHFRADDAGPQNRGWEENGFVRMVNPLVHHYYLAGLMKMWDLGNSGKPEPEWFLRLGCVLLSCGSAWLLFQFARRWTYHPILTTVLILLTPAFWLSSYSLLIDPPMVFFALAGLFFVIRSIELDLHLARMCGRRFLGLAILSKYPALLMLPVCALWIALNDPDLKHAWRNVGVFLIPLGFLLAYSLYTAHLYGQPHILAASARMVHMAAWPKLFSLLVFFSGSLLVPLAMWPLAAPRMRAVCALVGVALFMLLASSTGGFRSNPPINLVGVLVGDIASVLLESCRCARSKRLLPFINTHSYAGLLHFLHENRHDVFLTFWVMSFMGMMMAVMGWVAARYYCLVLPAVVFILVRLVERRWPAEATKALCGAAAFLFLISGALAHADKMQADPARTMGARLLANGIAGGERHFYLGDSFTMSYLKEYGWTPAFPETEFKPGDLVLSKDVTMPLAWFFQKHLNGRLLATYDFPSDFPLKVMDYNGSAGFYASVWGALPSRHRGNGGNGFASLRFWRRRRMSSKTAGFLFSFFRSCWLSLFLNRAIRSSTTIFSSRFLSRDQRSSDRSVFIS